MDRPKPDGTAAAHGLLEMVELFSVARFGVQAAFSPTERFLIEPPLARLIEKYGAVADQFGGLIDPLMVVAGVAIYAIRLTGSAKTQIEAQQAAQEKMNYKPSPPPENGASNHTEPPAATMDQTPPPPTVPGEWAGMFGGALHRQ